MKNWPLRLLVISASIFVIVILTLYFSGAWNQKSQKFPTATSTVQTNDSGTDNDGMDDEHAFLQADYNFDGYADRLQMLDCGATGNCSYLVQFYDPVTKKFPPDSVGEMDENLILTNPIVNKQEQLVCSYANTGASTYHLSVYRYIKASNNFSLVKEFSGSSDSSHGCTLK